MPGKDELGLAHIVMAAWPGVRDRGNRYQGDSGSGQQSRVSPASLVTAAGHHRRVQTITAACNDNIMPMLSMANINSGLSTCDDDSPYTFVQRHP